MPSSALVIFDLIASFFDAMLVAIAIDAFDDNNECERVSSTFVKLFSQFTLFRICKFNYLLVECSDSEQQYHLPM